MIVLDTHTLIWWVSGDTRLAATAKALIEDTLTGNGQVLVSAISAWELAMLVQRGRIALAMELDDWLRAVESIEGVAIVPITARVAAQSVNLPGEFHKDPADRMIVALARELNAPLITADEKIHRYPHVRWSW
ncbi:MAG: type II toxin-antitoxin system VapC family toxin [Xanthomonadaceae bacterium]|nr:type II toxin-antitoxin system VapC family toxin [Xanthomonadaceae bacterium]MDP2185286.1 type II toxin-antitoxin system VapC family toxin [Xanthomonadales bacterium]MDZ4115825.1 type II toxin-antitoxin system VapC family toxin [Xanthomonadaceae bacterium]MDZ4378654.1 type II toxin-antitoxin system VapC family toxin [Xanthomonadaceae bacterium]